MALTLDTIISLCKRRGFVFQDSEIYGGLASSYDYGPLGVTLKRNITNAWWRAMVEQRDDIEGLEAAITLSIVEPALTDQGWRFGGYPGATNDPVNGAVYLHVFQERAELRSPG